MEKIKEFLEVGYGSGSGYGCGDGSGYGYGYGYGYGCGSGFGCGDGYGDGSGFGFGFGCGDGYGDGSGFGYGDGSGYGDGDGDGYGCGDGSGYGIKIFNGDTVYKIDGVPTIIKSVRGNIAKGYILNNDLTLTPCYIAKGNNLFAHGETIKKAVAALQEKIFADMDTEEAIQAFLKEFKKDKRYSAKDFYVWHNRLTGSCEMGRKQFIANHGYDIENDTFTVDEFIAITKNDFGGDVIRQLEEAWKEARGC